MKDGYITAFIFMDKTKLMTKAAVLAYLEEHGTYSPSLAAISNQYEELFGVDPIWRYPLPDGAYNGAYIVPVQEGYLWIPYVEVDVEYYELLEPELATMLDADCCRYYLKTLQEYTADLGDVFVAIQQEITKEG